MIVGDTVGRAFHLLHQPGKVVSGAGNSGHSNGGALPQVSLFKFSYRNVEPGTQLVLQTSEDLPLVFQGMRCFDAQFECENGDRHKKKFRVSGSGGFEFQVGSNLKLET